MAIKVILGAGGHAKVLRAIVGGCLYGPDDPLPDGAEIFIGVGDIKIRRRLYEQYRDRVGCVVSPLADIPQAYIMRGMQVMPRVYVGIDCEFGENVLLNTGAQIDHDCKIGSHCVISPGAVLCGGVVLGECCAIGANATVLQNVELPAGTMISSGALVVAPDDIRVPA